MKTIIHSGLILIALTGCMSKEPAPAHSPAPQNEEEQEAVNRLIWIQQTDAGKDARDAIEAGDFRLFQASGPEAGLIAVPAEDQDAAQAQCGSRYLDGMTDMIHGPAHMALWKRANEYMNEYNKLVLISCLKHSVTN